jgi:hypothetical protein
MGRAKEWMLEQYERGYSQADGDICAQCVSDAALAAWIEANLSATQCGFCGRQSEEPIAASFDDFVGVVLAGISFDWNHPDSEGIMYISAEGGYQAPISDSWEVFADYDISEDSDVVEALIDSIDTDGWVEREFYHGDDSQRLVWGWDWFKHVTKHQTRYLFLNPDADNRDDIPASQMLDEIAKVVAADLGGFDLIKTIALGVDLFRIRVGAEGFDTAAAIGPPPAEFATQSNRMSPAGIPMFYGAFDVDTAKAETFEPAVHAGQTISIGAFRAMRELRILDLADLPDIPSVFDEDAHPLIHPLRFLHAFARDLVQPIARDGREHIEYVPTQIVTEYFRRVFRASDGLPVDGLIYTSSRNKGGRACVLFCENDQCAEADYDGPIYNRLLRLVGVVHEPHPPLD